MSNHALATLTATYTDSEPEGEEEDRVLGDDNSIEKSSEEDNSRGPSVERTVLLPPPVDIPRVTTLVSYHDDNAEDDDEEVTETKENTASTASNAIELPPEPSGRVSPRLAEKVSQLHGRMMAGLDMNKMIQNKKDFRNPSIYEKLIDFCKLNEFGTNYPPNIYDPLKWGKESYYEEISRVQKAEMDRREKEKKDKTKVEFVVGTKKPLTAEEEARKRKSKWDQVGGGGATGVPPTLLKATNIQPLTTSVSGTKSTVISAFGSLPKKSKI